MSGAVAEGLTGQIAHTDQPGPEPRPLGPFGLPAMHAIDWCALLVAAVMPVAYWPAMAVAGTAPKLTLLAGTMPLGLVLLVSLVRRRDVPAALAAAFVAAASVSALFGDESLNSFRGHIMSHSSVLIYAGVLGLWAIGRAVSDDARRLIGPVIIASTAANIAVGLLQIVFKIYSGPLATLEGRASGLMGNAAFYSSGIAGPAAYALITSARVRSGRWALVTGIFAFGAGISGARGAGSLLLLVAVGALAISRGRAWRTLSAVVAGLVVATATTTVFADTSTAGRFASKGADGRFDVWRFDLMAFKERPLFGWGFGNHGPAVRPHFTQAFTRASAWDDALWSWNDPHNVVMMLLVCTGGLGVLLIAGFVIAQLRRGADAAYLGGFMGAAAT